MKQASSLKIGISGVRGVVGESLTPQLCAALAQAFGTSLGGGTVVLGRDSRPSGAMVKSAVATGLMAVGCQPVDIGICPIPSIQVYTKETRASGAVEVTASHNPREWNGLKFISAEGLFLNSAQVEEFLDIYHQGAFALAGVDRLKSPRVEPDPTRPHRQKLLAAFDVPLIARKRIKVALDCGNGAGAVLAPQFLKELGCEVACLNATPDGSFAHHPEPLPENITELCRAVKEFRADVGFVQDADADRLAVVDENGEPLGEELTLALAARYVLSKSRGAIVTNLSTTRAIDDIARESEVPVYRTKIGEINVVEKILLLRDGVALGGEGNGGVIWPAVHLCRDSFAAMGLILEAMAAAGKTVSALRREVPEYHMIKGRMPGTREEASRLIRRLKKAYQAQGRLSTLDGLKVDFDDHWVHVRPSNTEPVIRVQAEARTRDLAEQALARLKKEIEGALTWK